MKQITILCASIWYKDQPTAKMLPRNIQKGIVISGHNHAQCLSTINALLGTAQHEQGEYVQGFLTSNNYFVDRVEAFEIATISNQIIKGKTYHDNQLFSEDLYK